MKSIFFLMLALVSITASAQNNTTCANMSPICTDSVLVFPLNFVTNGTPPQAEPGPNYGCCVPNPNPSWFYFEIASAGDVNMQMDCNVDIDYVIWGPFADLATAQSQCGSLGVAPNPAPVDCNALGGTNNNFPTITGASVGEVYVMMVTNFSNNPTTFELTQIGGTGGTDCSIVNPGCTSTPGTFTLLKDSAITTSPISLCANETFAILSNGDYTLPQDTISTANGGDSIYTAQLMFLIYDAAPSGGDPSADPGFTGVIIPSDSIIDINSMFTSPILDSLNINCGTVYFVPVAGDDGIGANGNMVGIGDNGQINYDLDTNDCYVLGDPIEVRYNCPLTVNGNILCTPTDNTISVNVNGGAGDVYAFTYLDGILSDDTIQTPDVVSVSNLMHNDTVKLLFVDEAGCMDSLYQEFFLPQFTDVSVAGAATCNTNGFVAVEVDQNSGNGGVVSITMNGIVETNTLPVDTLYAAGGTLVNIIITDANGCTSDSAVTIEATTHTIDINTYVLNGVSCNGGSDGSAYITAVGIDATTNQPDGSVITNITWIAPNGLQFPGGATNDTLTNMIHGQWYVQVSDDQGCTFTVQIVIPNPAGLNLNNTISNDPNCNGGNGGSITIEVLGGTTPYSYSVTDINGVEYTNNGSNAANVLSAGTYIITVTDANGCSSTISRTLVDPPAMDATFNVKNVACYGENTGSITAATVINGVAPYSYFWEPGFNNNPPTNTVANNLAAGDYTVRIVDNNGCERVWPFTITQNDSITMTLSTIPALCRTEGFQNGNGRVYATATGGANSSFTYKWTNLETGATSNNSTWNGRNPGVHELTVTDNLGCKRTDQIVLDSITPQAIFTVSSDDFDEPSKYEGTEPLKVTFTNESINFADSLNSNSDTIFQWNLDTGGEGAWFFTYDIDQKVDTVYDGEGVYEVCLIAKNYNNCADTLCVNVISHSVPSLVLPNVFTPGAEPNAEFFFPNVGLDEFEAHIFNRYGVEIFEFTDIEQKWDGTNKAGQECSDGVYYYAYDGISTNGTRFKGEGSVTLLRAK